VKITKVEPIPVDRYLFVKVHTDAGITGLGESGTWGYLEASQAVMEKYGHDLEGEDPLRIEHHWNYMYRSSHFRGAAIMGALSAIDIALWDIAGKHFGVPVYQLLGGKTRDRARVYYHVFGRTREQLVQGCVEAKKKGFTAVGHLTPFADEPREVPYFKTHAQKMADAIENVRQYREAVGNEVDLCVEIHRRLTPAEAVVLARGIEPFHPYFYEDPIGEDVPPKSEIVRGAAVHDGEGFLLISDKPGIGIELAADAAEKHPYRMRWTGTRLNKDGSVMDQEGVGGGCVSTPQVPASRRRRRTSRSCPGRRARTPRRPGRAGTGG
jgi:galactonate dehydratase